jgi:hypothetical protein
MRRASPTGHGGVLAESHHAPGGRDSLASARRRIRSAAAIGGRACAVYDTAMLTETVVESSEVAVFRATTR